MTSGRMNDKLEELMGAISTLRACLRSIGPGIDVAEIVLRPHAFSGHAVAEVQTALTASPSFKAFQASTVPGANMLAHKRCEVMGVTIREPERR